MKIRERLQIVILIATAAYSASMTLSASRLRTKLTALQATHQKLQKKHQQITESYIQFAANPGTKDQAFRNVIAVLEAVGEADMITSSDPGTTRINAVPKIRIK